jgi:hypothetical protein
MSFQNENKVYLVKEKVVFTVGKKWTWLLDVKPFITIEGGQV